MAAGRPNRLQREEGRFFRFVIRPQYGNNRPFSKAVEDKGSWQHRGEGLPDCGRKEAFSV
jgi:hypothetical protein